MLLLVEFCRQEPLSRGKEKKLKFEIEIIGRTQQRIGLKSTKMASKANIYFLES